LVDDDGMVTEGAASNAWIVTSDGKLITRPAGPEILRGITRTVIIDIAGRAGLDFEERSFSIDEAKSSREAFASSASLAVTPVIEIDGVEIAGGQAGPLTQRLAEELAGFVAGQVH
jgi:D-alanine transaminase